MTRSLDAVERTEPASEIDLGAIGAAIKRRRRAILLPTLLAFVGVTLFVNVVTPRYTAETQVLLENQENFFTRPDRANLPPEQAALVDPEAVASQVQLINSRDIARRAIKKLGLAGDPEFDALAGGLNPLTRVLVLLGVMHDPALESADSRIVTKFLEKLNVYSPTKTRVISIQFTSRNPALAARAANTVAQLYLQEQSAAKRATASVAADALAAQIADLRTKLSNADAERERYRSQSDLLAGSNNMTISGQQLADINSDLSKARSAQADAQAKAQLIRELLRAGKAVDVPDVVNNDIVRRVSDQRFAAQAQLARESRTLLSGHPRIKELTAQLAGYDVALKQAAKQAATSLENEARIAGARVANLETVLAQQKKSAGVANGDEVKLRALERVTQSYKDQLESSTAKYQEALARQASTATPADARIISSATRPQEPTFPKKIPYIVFGTVAAFVLAVGYVVATELLSGGAVVEQVLVSPEQAPVASEKAPAAQRTEEPLPVPETRRTEALPVEAVPEEAAPEGAHDPVFAPVKPQRAARPTVETMRNLAAGGMLAATLSYIKGFGRSAAESRNPEDGATKDHAEKSYSFGWDSADATPVAATQIVSLELETPDVAVLTDKIVSAHVPGRGLHIVGTGLVPRAGAAVSIELGRSLAKRGRAVIVDLNRLPLNLMALTAANDKDAPTVETMHGLAELLAGDATFAEVIHRDHASRLHFIPAGIAEADFRDFDLILDALSETYDFVLLLTPDFPQSEITKVMAPYADFIVVAVGKSDASTADVERELLDAGAREVLVARPADRLARQEVA